LSLNFEFVVIGVTHLVGGGQDVSVSLELGLGKAENGSFGSLAVGEVLEVDGVLSDDDGQGFDLVL